MISTKNCLKLVSASCIVWACLFLCSCGGPVPGSIQISEYPQLLLDDYLIESKQNLSLVMNHPKPHPANPILVQDRPWEKRFVQMYGTVLYDREAELFRMWYMASENEDQDPEYYMCYAESADGIDWVKPMAGIESKPPYIEHNIVLMDGHGFCVFKDKDEDDPAKRYKGLGGDIAGFSSDGISWETYLFPAADKNDTSSSVIRWGGKYMAFVQNRAHVGDLIRSFIRG